MRSRLSISVLAATIIFGGASCTVKTAAALAAPKRAECAVCREGEEPVKATAMHQGKEYYFCSTNCRDQFLKDPGSFVKSAAPRPAPAFSLKTLDGRTVSLADQKGKVVLLDFWATFCAPCVKAMPKLQKLHDEHAARGFTVIGIATDEKGASVVAPVVAKTKVKYPIVLANEAAWKEYDVRTLPTMFLIDRGGRIVKQFGGTVDHKTVEAEVKRLLAE
jgi:peroxiredoxin